MKVSFIIPAYNALSTIARTLDSIYMLPLKSDDFEVIVIDDCSTDKTLSLLHEYAESKENMRVLSQVTNRRQGAARNWGVKEAAGEYIMFVDADDSIAEGFIESMTYALSSKVDMLFCTTAWENESHAFVPREYNIPPLCIMRGDVFAEKYYDVVCVGPWTYLWRREFLILTNIPFIENRRMEDFDFVEKHIVLAEKIAYSAPVIYNYHINQGSTVRTMTYETLADWVHVCYRRWLFCDALPSSLSNFISKIDNQCKCFVSSSLSFRRLSRFSGRNVLRALDRIGGKELSYIYTKAKWPFFTTLCIKHKFIVVVIISVVFPIAECSRFLVHSLRKICKK